MKYLPKNNAFSLMLIGIFVMTLSGCSSPKAARTGFIMDYSDLKPHPEIDGKYEHINPNFDPRKFNKFIVDPVAVNLSKEAMDNNIDPKDLNRLAKYFRQQIGKELRKGYKIVGKPGPDVARVRTSISEIDKAKPLLNIHPGSKISGIGLGGAGSEMELIHSVSGERIMAAIDYQKGSRLDITGGLTYFGNAETVMENWAKALKMWVDQAHGKSSKN